MIDADRAIWRAAVAQAFTDLMISEPDSNTKGARSRLRIRAKAVKWLTTPSLDLSIVCQCADLAPGAVIKAAKEILAGRDVFGYETTRME